MSELPNLKKKHPIPVIKLSSLVLTYYESPSHGPRGISLFYNVLHCKSTNYNVLHCKSTFCKSNPILRWEEDLQKTFTPEQWLQSFRFTHGISKCNNHWEPSQKILSCGTLSYGTDLPYSVTSMLA